MKNQSIIYNKIRHSLKNWQTWVSEVMYSHIRISIYILIICHYYIKLMLTSRFFKLVPYSKCYKPVVIYKLFLVTYQNFLYRSSSQRFKGLFCFGVCWGGWGVCDLHVKNLMKVKFKKKKQLPSLSKLLGNSY